MYSDMLPLIEYYVNYRKDDPEFRQNGSYKMYKDAKKQYDYIKKHTDCY